MEAVTSKSVAKDNTNQPKLTDLFNFKRLNREEILKVTSELDDLSVESELEDENDNTQEDAEGISEKFDLSLLLFK